MKTSAPSRLTEGEIKGLSREVTDDIGSISPPESNGTLASVSTDKSIADTLVWLRKTTLLDLKDM